MDRSQNSNHNCWQPSESDEFSEYADPQDAAADLPDEQPQRRAANRSKCDADASEDGLKAEIAELRVELDDVREKIECSEEGHVKCRDDLSREFCELSQNYRETSETLVQLQIKNKSLQQDGVSKALAGKRLTKEIKQLECIRSQNAECNEKMENSIQQAQKRVDVAARQLAEADQTIASRTAEGEKLRCRMSNAERTFCDESAKLAELLRRAADNCRQLDELTVECRETGARAAAARETAAVRLHAAEREADAARAQLADALAALDEWLARGERAAGKLRDARAERDADACRGRDELARLAADRDALAARAADAADRLRAAECENRHLTARAAEKTERLAAEAAEVKRLERLADGERQRRAAQRAACAVQAKMMDDRAAVDRQRLVAADEDMDALRRARERREQAIKAAADRLDELQRQRQRQQQQQQQQPRQPPTGKKTIIDARHCVSGDK